MTGVLNGWRVATAGALLFAAIAGAAAGAAAHTAPAHTAPAQEGHYVGSGISLRQASPFCPGKMSIRGFRVSGGQVRFGGFRGPVQPDGSVRLPYGGAWLMGRFDGAVFRGEVDQYSAKRHDRCSYVIELTLQPS